MGQTQCDPTAASPLPSLPVLGGVGWDCPPALPGDESMLASLTQRGECLP